MTRQLPILPLPGDPLGPDLVIASCWQNDDSDDEAINTATVVVLHPEPPYYGVVQLTATTEGDWQRESETVHLNLVETGEDYRHYVY